MPYFSTAQEWLTQSSLLMQARPSTTRITTKYTIRPTPTASKPPKPSTSHPPTDPASTPAPAARALLTIKTFDPVSGTTLKYRTDKAAEVGRLVLSLSRLGRTQAALPEEEDVAMGDAAADGEAEVKGDAKVEGKAAVPAAPAASAGQQQPAGKKGKKKGKK